MNNKQEPAGHVVTNGRISRLFVSAGIYQNKQWIEKNCGSLFKPNAVLSLVTGRLVSIPNKALAIQFKVNFHNRDCIHRIYVVNTSKNRTTNS